MLLQNTLYYFRIKLQNDNLKYKLKGVFAIDVTLACCDLSSASKAFFRWMLTVQPGQGEGMDKIVTWTIPCESMDQRTG